MIQRNDYQYARTILLLFRKKIRESQISLKYEIYLTNIFDKIFIKRVFFEAEIDVARDTLILKLFKRIVNQKLYAYSLWVKEILYLLSFGFDRNAVETENIFIDVSICSFHFSTKYDVLQQMFVHLNILLYT